MLGPTQVLVLEWALAQVLALVWAVSYKGPWRVRLYLATQLVAVPLESITYSVYGDKSLAYLIAYLASTSVVLVAIGIFSWDFLKSLLRPSHGAAMALLASLLTGKLAYLGALRTLGFDDWIVLVEGVVLLTCGIIAGYTAAYRVDWSYSLIFCLLWLAQGTFDLGWLLNDFRSVNWTIPPLLGLLGFLSLGFALKANANLPDTQVAQIPRL